MANPFKEAEKAKKKAPGSKVEHEPVVKEEKIETVEAPVEPVVSVEPVVPVEQPEEKPEVKPEVKQEEKPEEKPEVKTESKPAGKAEKKVEKPEEPVRDIFAKLEAEKPSGKTYAFYLSDDNVAKLKKMAEKKKISASKLLDHILSEIL